MQNRKGFTLIELLIVIGILGILAGVVIVAINPARQFAQANNTRRETAVNSILNAIGQRIADNRGNFVTGCDADGNGTAGEATDALPTGTAQTMADDNPVSATQYNIAACLVPTYIPSLPVDPSTGAWTSAADYNTGFTVIQAADGRVTVAAPGAEAVGGVTPVISATR